MSRIYRFITPDRLSAAGNESDPNIFGTITQPEQGFHDPENLEDSPVLLFNRRHHWPAIESNPEAQSIQYD